MGNKRDDRDSGSDANRYPKRANTRGVYYGVDIEDIENEKSPEKSGIKWTNYSVNRELVRIKGKNEGEIIVKEQNNEEEYTSSENDSYGNDSNKNKPNLIKDTKAELSAYELKRLEIIKKNQAMLASLNLANNLLLEPFKNQKQSKRKGEKKDKVLPVRQSSRLKGLAPNIFKYMGDKAKKKENSAVNEEDDVLKDGKFEVKDTYYSLVDELKENDVKERVKVEIREESDEKGEKRIITNQLENIKCITHRALKVCDDFIHCAQFHSNKEKVLLSVGSKVGEVSLLDASYYVNRFKNKEYIEDLEYDYEAHLHRFRPHYHTISGLKFQPNQEHCLLTCSYDNTIKKMDLNQQESITTFNYLNDMDSICSLDIQKFNNNLAYFSTFGGNVGLHDLREYKSATHKLTDSKISTISLNPKYEHIFATASADKTVKIYDSRYLSEKRYLYQSKLSSLVSSAHFDPTGKKLVTTSFENSIKVFDYHQNNANHNNKSTDMNMNFSPTITIRHNCRVAALISIFQAKFHPDPNLVQKVITVGDTSKNICFYNSIDGKALFRFANKELISATPAVIEYHPKVRFYNNYIGNLLTAGVGKGRILMFM
ncbi:WD40 repeat-like protein [Neoconidiobolus thromboides FSU 785]|nr:WD40 repeat-like protein [Neoconidiobolus thromboides FSU 785]